MPFQRYRPLSYWVNRFRRVVFGPQKRTDLQHQERLSVPVALGVFSADGLSSVAYATEEILWILMVGGVAATAYSLPIGVGIVVLVLIVAASYSQTIHAYPHGGGSYIVSLDNLGTNAGLVAGAALLIDYVLTVAVSSAAGVAAITSAVPFLRGHQVSLSLLSVWFIAWVNLRGVRESGKAFLIPTYSFIACVLALVGYGAYRAVFLGDWHPALSPAAGFRLAGGVPAGITLFLLLRAFSSGCTALTGLEAISNGVQAFRPPEDKHAIQAMNLERTLLYLMFAGITLLAFGHRVLPTVHETVLSQIAKQVFGQNFFYYAIQATTTMILLLAANTAYADFPRLASFIARDGYLPRRLAQKGDTLVFNGGIYLIATLASVLLVIFRGSTHLLIPLYAVGVFTAFTLSQTGMVVHWVKEAKRNGTTLRGWSILLNGTGALLSGIVLVVVAVSKFLGGAWVVMALIPLIVVYFRSVREYYTRFTKRIRSLESVSMAIDNPKRVKAVVTFGGLSPLIDHALAVAEKMASDIVAVHVAVDPDEGARVARKWDKVRHHGVELVVLESPYRSVAGPLLEYLLQLRKQNPDCLINLLVPTVVTNDPLDFYLHNGTADQVARELRFTHGILLTIVPFYVDMSHGAKNAIVQEPDQAS